MFKHLPKPDNRVIDVYRLYMSDQKVVQKEGYVCFYDSKSPERNNLSTHNYKIVLYIGK